MRNLGKPLDAGQLDPILKAELTNNQENLAYLVHQILHSKKVIDEHEERLEELQHWFLNHRKIRAVKYTEIGKAVRKGFDIQELEHIADVILLDLLHDYYKGKAHSEIEAYTTVAFPKVFWHKVWKLRENHLSLDDLENMDESILSDVDQDKELRKEVLLSISTLKGTIKEVGLLLFEGYTLVEIEEKLGIGAGGALYYKARLVKKLLEDFGIPPKES